VAYERPGESLIDYHHCRYKQSKIQFRGPKRQARKGAIALIGGTETYGKFVERPFSELLEASTGMPAVNLGAVNAGIDVFLNEDAIFEICDETDYAVVQVMGAQNMSNRFYSVHPRRNDRFLKASVLLQTIYREVDFTEFAFTRHLLGTLKKVSPEKFSTVEAELKAAWSARMELFLSRLKTPKKILLWVSDRPPEMKGLSNSFGGEPLFIDKKMIDGLRSHVDHVVQVTVSRSMARNTDGMKFPPLEESAAIKIIGPDVHAMVADQLAATIARDKSPPG
jgi:hypothetical protein